MEVPPANVKLNSIDELPAYLKYSIKYAAKWRNMVMLLILFTTPMFIMIFVGITGVLSAGVTIGILSSIGNLFNTATSPDFTKGFFLNILLADKNLSIKNQSRIIIWNYLWNGHCRINCISIDDLFFCSSICIRELFRTTHVYNFNYCSINFICLLLHNRPICECAIGYNVS